MLMQYNISYLLLFVGVYWDIAFRRFLKMYSKLIRGNGTYKSVKNNRDNIENALCSVLLIRSLDTNNVKHTKRLLCRIVLKATHRSQHVVVIRIAIPHIRKPPHIRQLYPIT